MTADDSSDMGRMTELYVVVPAAPDEACGRIPDSLPVNDPERALLERALREAGLAILAVDSHIPPSASVDDRPPSREVITAVVNAATDDELNWLWSAVADSNDDDLDSTFWGLAPDSATVAHAAFSDLQDQFAARRVLSDASISREEAARLLDVAPQTITAKLGAHKLVGIKVGREWRLPLWQFDPDSPSCVLPELDVLQSVFPGGVVSLSVWMQREQPEFGGRRPRDEMALCGAAAVIAFAQSLTAAAR